MRKIIKNAIQCKLCGEIIESTYRHEYVECKCGSCAVDGGHDYLRRSFKDSYECAAVNGSTHKKKEIG